MPDITVSSSTKEDEHRAIEKATKLYESGRVRSLPERGLSLPTIQKYEVRATPDGSHHYYPYFSQEEDLVSVKTRFVEKKEFTQLGIFKELQLFGQRSFGKGAGKLTICEGEIDTMSVYEMMGRKYQCVGIRSAGEAVKNCTDNYKWIDSFDTIYLCFDNDDAGKKATQDVAQLFDSSKIKIVDMSLKDPNEYLMSGKAKQFISEWWDATQFEPDGVVATVEDFWTLANTDIQHSSVGYPWEGLNKATYGIRLGEVVLITAPEGVGKTLITREIEWKILQDQQEHGIGIFHLEENAARTVKGLMSMAANKPLHLPDTEYTKKEFQDAFTTTFGTGRIRMFSNFDHNSFSSIESRMRFMCRVHGCRYFILDHISILVSDQEGGGDERKLLDQISTKLRFLCQELDIAIVMVSHVNDDGKTRGSRNISKVADIWIHLDRDLTTEDERERNTTHVTIRKNRFSGITGHVNRLYYEASTSRMVDIQDEASETVEPVVAEVVFEDSEGEGDG